MAESPTLYLIDGSGFIFRAFHALPPMNRGDGVPVHAVYGFCTMLHKLQTDKQTTHAAVVFDAGRKTFRNKLYPQYKANRPKPPPELVQQFPLVREAARAFGFPAIESEGFEADDLIAAYTAAARAQGWQVEIVSSDKDLMQLVGDGVVLFDPLKNKTLGMDAVIEKFGVPPAQVVDVQALAGDSSDNIPGAHGIGIKIAAQLITQYGSLENLLARAGELPQPKRRETLQQCAEQIHLSKKLVSLDATAPLPQPLESLRVAGDVAATLTPFLQAQGFKTLLARLGGDAAPATVVEGLHYTLIQDLATLQHWVDEAVAQGFVAVDTETTSLQVWRAELVGVSLALQPGKACYIPVGHINPDADNGALWLAASGAVPLQLPLAEVIRCLKPLLENPAVLKIGHNMKYDWQVFAHYGIDTAPVDDTMLLSFCLDAGRHGHGLDELAQLHCKHTMISYDDVTGKGSGRISFAAVPLQKACAYAAEDADYTLRLHQVLKPLVMQEKLLALYEGFERPMVRVVAHMERSGMKVDGNLLRGLGRGFTARLAMLEKEIIKEAGVSFNLASPKQMGEVLFDKLGYKGGKKGKKGAYSTSSAVLENFAEQGSSLAEKILQWRALAKLKSTYTDALPQQMNPATGRIHTAFSLVGAATGRLSSTDPNLQNIPIRTADGRSIRRAFVAETGNLLLSVDYSQIELRLVAEMAGITAMKQAFRAGLDIHAATAAQVFGLEVAAVTPEQRRQAKAINFGIIYGISGFGLARQLGCTPVEAAQFIETYLNQFAELRQFMERCKEEARAKGYVTTLFGRRCHIRSIHDKNSNLRHFAERQAINAPIQGSAADMMKLAMARMDNALTAAKLNARLVLQVHDELIFEVPLAEKDHAAATIRTVMEGVASLSIPLVAEAGFGENWAEAH